MDGNDQPPRKKKFFEKRVGEYSKFGISVDKAD